MTPALQEWREILNEDQIKVDDQLSEYGKCISGATRRIKAVLLPKSTEEVQDIVRIANNYKVPLFPISTGKNWGYGTTNPIENDCVIVELSRMKKIKAFDKKLGTVSVEPGVTQGDLYNYLAHENMNFYVPISGSSPDCSLVGNALERGFGVTPIADHFLGINSLKAVLPDGSIYQSLMDEMGGSESQRVYKWGIGPILEGLFSQGNLGIVIEATIELVPRYQNSWSFIFTLKDQDALLRSIEASRDLQSKSGLCFSSIKFFNSRYLMALRDIQPCGTSGFENMSQAQLKLTEKKYSLDSWTGIGGIYGDDLLNGASKKIVFKYLKPHCKKIFAVNKQRLKILESMVGFMPANIKQQIQGLRTLLDFQDGVTSSKALSPCYWKSKKLPQDLSTLDPLRDGCGNMWFVPILPFDDRIVGKYISLVEGTCAKYGIEPVMNFTCRTKISLYSLVMLIFDPNLQLQAARECRKELMVRARDELSISPYRMNVDEIADVMQEMKSRSTAKLMSDIKGAIDPNGIISPSKFAYKKF